MTLCCERVQQLQLSALICCPQGQIQYTLQEAQDLATVNTLMRIFDSVVVAFGQKSTTKNQFSADTLCRLLAILLKRLGP